MFYYLYQITNKVNNKIYVGVHKTKNFNDGYMGSGKVIRSAMVNHGIDNFEKVILEYFGTLSAMYAKEAEVVDEEFLLQEDVYNLRRGGHGGFDYINSDAETRIIKNRKARDAANETLKNVYGENYASIIGKLGIETQRANKSGIFAEDYISVFADASFQKEMNIRAHSEDANIKRTETFKKIGHQQGEKNSQFGKRFTWITNGMIIKKIKKDEIIPDGYRKGKKIFSVTESY